MIDMKLTYMPFDKKPLTWEEIPIGMICYHIWSKDFRIKTGKKSYFSFDEHQYHTLGKLLTEHPTDKRNFIPCNYEMNFNDDLLNIARKLWYTNDPNSSGCKDK